MTDFNTIWLSASKAITSALGEPITINLPAGPRVVNAIVDDFPPTDPHTPGALAPKKVIEVDNDATTGYSAAEAQRYGGITVTLRESPGSAKTITVPLAIPPAEWGKPWVDAGRCTFFLW